MFSGLLFFSRWGKITKKKMNTNPKKKKKKKKKGSVQDRAVAGEREKGINQSLQICRWLSMVVNSGLRGSRDQKHPKSDAEQKPKEPTKRKEMMAVLVARAVLVALLAGACVARVAFGPGVEVDTNMAGACACALDDLDGDGNLDAVAVSWSAPTVAWWRNNGDGTSFGSRSPMSPLSLWPWALATGMSLASFFIVYMRLASCVLLWPRAGETRLLSRVFEWWSVEGGKVMFNKRLFWLNAVIHERGRGFFFFFFFFFCSIPLTASSVHNRRSG